MGGRDGRKPNAAGKIYRRLKLLKLKKVGRSVALYE